MSQTTSLIDTLLYDNGVYFYLGTRTQGNAGNFKGKMETSKAVRALRQAMDEHRNAKTLGKMVVKTLAISNPYIGLLVLGTELANSAYKGLKTYQQTGDLKKAMISSGIETAKVLTDSVLLPGGVRTASNLLVPGLVAKFAGKGIESEKLEGDTRMIKSAIEGAAGVLT